MAQKLEIEKTSNFMEACISFQMQKNAKFYLQIFFSSFFWDPLKEVKSQFTDWLILIARQVSSVGLHVKKQTWLPTKTPI